MPGGRRLAALLAVAGTLVAACGVDDAPGADRSADGEEARVELEGTVTVSAASSLTEAFSEIADRFGSAHPDVTVQLNLDSSSKLAAQILDGAPADVYASADEESMARLTEADLVAGEPVVFARNELVIVTEPGNPNDLTGLADLTDAGVVALCALEAPCGRFTQRALDLVDVAIPETRVTRGQNVKTTLTAVAEGDAVAGIVYATDARAAADRVTTVAITEASDVTATYPVAVLRDAGDAHAARAFVDLVAGEEGRAVLREHGFLPPP